MLLSMLHFPESDGETGELKKVQYIVKHFSEQFRCYYMPKREVSIDESLIGFEGRAPAVQYMPDKHHHRNWTRTQNHLALKRTLNHLAKPAK